jgi:hypothetical protein
MSDDISLEKVIKKFKRARKSRKAVDVDNLTIAEKNALASLSADPGPSRRFISGIGCGRLFEPIPRFNKAVCEKFVAGPNNSSIVLGRDRPRSIFSGYGGMGFTGAGHIDLVAGRMSHNPMSKGPLNEAIYVDPDFELDAARIYISQKTDIDANLGIDDIHIPGYSLAARGAEDSESPLGIGTHGRSGIAIKADEVRIVGREDIKIVTGTDPKNSLGGKVESVGGIFLIAGQAENEGDTIEPLVKGNKLTVFLRGLMEEVQQLRTCIYGFMDAQHEFNQHIKNHVHISPFFAKPTLPSNILLSKGQQCNTYHMDNTFMGMDQLGSNFEIIIDDYLAPNAINYICSRHNKTN